ncbi:hypothetical protein B0H13DRAFT_2318308 [Mycena leptocephala]|nr:hypothetical protein B0H13DRAFT_2318308 [Mycena leptocephala]
MSSTLSHLTLAVTAPSDPNRDEAPYEYVDACRCVLIRILLPLHVAHAPLPAVLGAMSVFDSVCFLPAPPICSAQTDSATIAIPKPKFWTDVLRLSGPPPPAPSSSS